MELPAEVVSYYHTYGRQATLRKFGLSNSTLYASLARQGVVTWRRSPVRYESPIERTVELVKEKLDEGLTNFNEIALAIGAPSKEVARAMRSLGWRLTTRTRPDDVTRDQLVRALSRDLSKTATARALGISTGLLTNLLARHGLSIQRKPSTVTTAAELHQHGVPIRDIARSLGLKPQSVRTALARRGLINVSRPSRLAGITPAALAKLRNDLGSWNRVSQHIGSTNGLRSYRRQHRIDERFGPFVQSRFHTRRPSRWGLD